MTLRGRVFVMLSLAALLGVAALLWRRATEADPLLYTIPVGAVSNLYSSNPDYRDPMALDQRGGHAFVVLTSGIALVDTRAGRIPRTLPIGPGSATVLAPDNRTGQIIGIGGPVSVLDARSGGLVSTAHVPVYPVDVAVVVLNSGGLVRGPDPWTWVPSWLRQHIWFLQPHRNRHRHLLALTASASFSTASSFIDMPASISVLDPTR